VASAFSFISLLFTPTALPSARRNTVAYPSSSISMAAQIRQRLAYVVVFLRL
jgi:hypothetical protein